MSSPTTAKEVQQLTGRNKKDTATSLLCQQNSHPNRAKDEDWRIPFIKYIRDRTIPNYTTNPRSFQCKASFYTIVGTELFKRAFSQPLLRCLHNDNAQLIMNKIHEGIYENRTGGCSLATKILQARGTAISLDNSRKGITVPMKKIICRFGMPGEIISDNGRQFTDKKVALFLQNFNIKHHFSLVEHPQTNGKPEAANQVMLQAIKKKLDKAKGQWAELVLEVLWSYNTTISTPLQKKHPSDWCMEPRQ
ncbi:uncharacterized protein [Arachis hypogaea]|uniref:uncharacterized protein n=1 Tax=Arachis hypogaea TaxID=3818 RepID=UPI003B21CBEE